MTKILKEQCVHDCVSNTLLNILFMKMPSDKRLMVPFLKLVVRKYIFTRFEFYTQKTFSNNFVLINI